MYLFQVMNVRNVMVVVSRWYGGVHLGPDRFRLINNAAKEVLEKGNFIPPPEGKKKKWFFINIFSALKETFDFYFSHDY